jgi:hypothetical protein
VKQLQYKSISDDEVLRAIDAGHGAIWELESALNQPPNAVLSKLRSMVKRKLVVPTPNFQSFARKET